MVLALLVMIKLADEYGADGFQTCRGSTDSRRARASVDLNDVDGFHRGELFAAETFRGSTDSW